MTIESEKIKELVKNFGISEDVSKTTYDKIAPTLFKQQVKWDKNTETSTDFSFMAMVNSRAWKLRINNFPDEPMYTLFIDDKAILTFDDMPATWTHNHLDIP